MSEGGNLKFQPLYFWRKSIAVEDTLGPELI
jgi:hypothetical protein